jgi:uncharacterized protein with GYD domain
MPIFVMLTTLTDAGRKTIKNKPERMKEVNNEVEAHGLRIIDQFALLGPYDFVNILEAPDVNAVSRVALALGARGTLQTMTMAAIPVDEFIASLKEV